VIIYLVVNYFHWSYCRELFLGTAMSDIYETELAYDAACKERGVNSHPMIQEVLTVDKEENLM